MTFPTPSTAPMGRRSFLALLGIAATVPAAAAVAGCGADEAAPVEAPDTLPPVSDPAPTAPPPAGSTPAVPGTGAPAADGAEAGAVLTYTESGGFTTRELAFQDPPIVLITDDGRVITGAVTTMMFPGPLVPPHSVRSIEPAGVEAILAAADEAGLLGELDPDELAGDELIADASTATLEITAPDGTTRRHEAYALGLGAGMGGPASESTPARRALRGFLDALVADPEGLAGAGNLGEEKPWVPAAYQLVATPADEVDGGPSADPDLAPTTVPWPEGTGGELAAATSCVEVERAAIGSLLDDADQLTRFEQGGTSWSLIVRPAYPGRSCPSDDPMAGGPEGTAGGPEGTAGG